MHRKLGRPHYIFTLLWQVHELFLQRNPEQFPARSSICVKIYPAENTSANLPVEVDGTTDGVGSYNQLPLVSPLSPKRENSGLSLAPNDETDEGVRAHSFSCDIR